MCLEAAFKIQQDQQRYFVCSSCVKVHTRWDSMTVRKFQVWGISKVLSWCCVSLGAGL